MSDFAQPIDIAIPAKPEYVGIARLVIAAFAKLLGFDSEVVEDIKVAVSEACTSAILQLHRGPQSEDRSIDISAYAESDRLIIDIGFIIAEAVSIEIVRMQLNERDLGMSILTSIVDEVEVIEPSPNRVILRLAKSISG